MALRITKASDPITIEQLVTCIYAPPGVGKSTLSFTADKPLSLDFDGGIHRAAIRGDAVRVEKWADVDRITADDLRNYRTLIFDTAGRALDVLTVDIIEKNPKLGRSGGALTLQGFGELKSRFIAFLKMARGFGLDIVLLAHSDEQKNGDDLIERIDVQGGSKNEIYKAADVMGRLYMRNGKRYLNFNPSDTAHGKNPGQEPELEVPEVGASPHFLTEVILRVKTTLNHATAEQQAAGSALAEWKERLDKADSPRAMNDLIPQVRDLPPNIGDNVKRLLVKIGEAKGFKWDKEAKQFEVPVEAAKPSFDDKFNPISQTSKDGITRKQEKQIKEAAEQAGVTDIDGAASRLFGITIKLNELSSEAAERLIAYLDEQAIASSAPF